MSYKKSKKAYDFTQIHGTCVTEMAVRAHLYSSLRVLLAKQIFSTNFFIVFVGKQYNSYLQCLAEGEAIVKTNIKDN